MIKQLFSCMFCLLLGLGFVPPTSATDSAAAAKNSAEPDLKKNCASGRPRCNSGKDSTCSPEMRGRCGKRRGDWYGARQPVADGATAHGLLSAYFAGQGYTVSPVAEKKWGFCADVIDKEGTVVDRVMIDKRSGRIRTLN